MNKKSEETHSYKLVKDCFKMERTDNLSIHRYDFCRFQTTQGTKIFKVIS